MNTSQTERLRGHGALTTLVGLATTALAFDAAESESLHVTVESEEDRPEDEPHQAPDDGVEER